MAIAWCACATAASSSNFRELSPARVVYMGMFEQSLLLDHAAAKKTGALAASLTVQTLAVGVMIALPLIFSDRLPDVPRFISLSLPSPPPPLPPPVEHATSSTSSSRANSGPRKVFTAPTHINDLSQLQDVGFVEAPPSYASSTDGVPGGTGLAPALGQLFRDTVILPKPHVPELQAPPTVVGGKVQEANLLKKVIPIYPPLARQARVSGTVELIGIIARDGTIQQLQVVSGHPLLIKSALDAVRQWVYRPTLLNGQAVEVIAPISVIFTLSQ
jgi:protein TonB